MSGSSQIMVIATVIGVILVAAIVAAVAGGVKSRPKFNARAILTGNEHEFFSRLTRALPDMYVWPQVAMSALIEPKVTEQKARLAAFRTISQKRVDFAICEGDLAIVCVVELDDRTHEATRDRERDAMLLSAGIRTIRWQSKSKPTVPEIQAAVAAVRDDQMAKSEGRGK